ncbi:unnamed protein product [Linum trigynum]|uniref:BAG domain-containing protein n=1 Tax=Linum trigynum TaxID=586398 RepID=A0AAV2GNU0_9ROSI
MAVTKSQKAAEKVVEEAAREKVVATTAATGQGDGGKASTVAAAPPRSTSLKNPSPQVVRILETVTMVDETGVDELQVAVKELMTDREHAEKRRQEDKEEILQAIARLTKDLEVTRGRQQRIKAKMGLEFAVVTTADLGKEDVGHVGQVPFGARDDPE